MADGMNTNKIALWVMAIFFIAGCTDILIYGDGEVSVTQGEMTTGSANEIDAEVSDENTDGD